MITQDEINRINAQRRLKGLLPLTHSQITTRAAYHPNPTEQNTSTGWLLWFVLWDSMTHASSPTVENLSPSFETDRNWRGDEPQTVYYNEPTLDPVPAQDTPAPSYDPPSSGGSDFSGGGSSGGSDF